MLEPVAKAIEELKAAFPDSAVIVTESGDGGAHVFLESVDPGRLYAQRETWIGFTIPFQYPFSDVHPLFVRPDLVRADGRPLGDGLSPGCTFCGRPAVQLSRRSNRRDPAVEDAALKVVKVLKWLQDHE